MPDRPGCHLGLALAETRLPNSPTQQLVWDEGPPSQFLPQFTDGSIDWQLAMRPNHTPGANWRIGANEPPDWCYRPLGTLKECVEAEFHFHSYSMSHTCSGIVYWVKFGGAHHTHPEFAPGWRVVVAGGLPAGIDFYPLGPDGPSASRSMYHGPLPRADRCGVWGLASREWAMLAGKRLCKFLACMRINPAGVERLPDDFFDRVRSPLDGSDTRSRRHWSRRPSCLQIARESPPAAPAAAPVAPSPVGVAHVALTGLGRQFMESRRPREVVRLQSWGPNDPVFPSQ